MLLVLSDKGKGMHSSSEEPLVGEEHCVTTLITAAKETNFELDSCGRHALAIGESYALSLSNWTVRVIKCALAAIEWIIFFSI